MVNFGAHLAASQVKGWEKYYVDYDALRAACSKESQCSIDEFFSLWKFELDKAQAFFEKISRETLKSLISLRSSNALADRLCCSLPGLSKSLNRGYNDTISEISLDLDDLEKGLQEVISKSLPLFDNRRQFCLLNVEALRKSASKCSKYLDSRMGDHLFALLSMSPMASSLAYDFGANLSAIIHEIEENKCRNLENATTKSNDQRELINRKQINGRSGSQDSIYDELDSPFDLLCVMMNNMDPEVKKRLVSHRGFHSTQDRLERPLENTLAAYEQAWAAGVHYCECDVTLTLDQRIVLCHDPELYRLAHNKVKTSKSEVSKGILPITQLTFDELLTFPLKNGSHAPLLEDVLRSARRVGPEAKLIIEIKSGVHGSKVASTLCYMLCASPELLSHVAVIMSFDLYIVHNFCKFFDAELATVECTRPKVLFLTKNPDDTGVEHEMALDWHGSGAEEIIDQLEGYARQGNTCLDGFYVQYHSSMLTESSKTTKLMKELSKKYIIGVWGGKGDPDDVNTCKALARLGCHFLNTDIPYDFITDLE